MTVKPQNTYLVSVFPRSPGAEIHAAIAAIDGSQESVSLMAAGLSFATPREVCGLRALLDHAAAHAAVVDFDCPSSRDVHLYLARMNFYTDLPANVVLSRPPPAVRRRDRQTRLIEACRIRSSDDVERLMDRVWSVAGGQFGAGPVAKACATALGAATENVVDHAQSPIGALVAAQRYRRRGLELAVVDLGVGIPATLARNRAYASLSDVDAVEHALQDGVSSTAVSGRGAGLAELVDAVERAGNSTLTIQSGHAHLNLSWRRGDGTVQRQVPSHPVPGTWISLRLKP